MSRLTLVIVLGLLVTALGGACDGDTADEPTGSPVASPPSSQATSTAPTVEPGATLVDFQSPSGLFRIRYPEGWTTTESGVAGSGFTFTLQRPGGTAAARVAVSCTRSLEQATYDELIAEDVRFAGSYGDIEPSEREDIEVAGVAGKRLRYFTNFQGVAYVEHDLVYALAGDCAWRLHLQSWGKDTIGRYTGLFEEMVASFQPG